MLCPSVKSINWQITVIQKIIAKISKNFGTWPWLSRSLRSKGQVYYSVLEDIVPSVVVAKYEENTSRNKKVIINVKVFGW